ncbi:MAG: glycosyltransferase family 4 protein [Candidatus Altiarchaeota archaeon]
MKKIKILMFGWEFPPFSTGGLGTACYGLTKGLVRNGADITFVLPRSSSEIKNEDYMKIISTENFKYKKGKIKFVRVDSILKPYISSKEYEEKFGLEKFSEEHRIYGADLFSEVLRYAKHAREIAKSEDFDIIHCHDWLTFLCGIEAKKVAKRKGKKAPLIVHVHATEFDRTIGNPNRFVYEIEQKGMEEANYIITVSEYTKNMILKHYNVSPKKIRVVHNSIDPEFREIKENFKLKEKYKIVIFLGRITIQKGPLHFLWIAKKVLEKDKNVRFIVVGSGDMQQYMIEEAANLGIGDKILFMDFVSGEDVDKAYKFADVFVMPSISEPFGLAALEAVKNGIPAVVSKQSGVIEVLRNCLIADFWDINEMANKILALLKYTALRSVLIEEGLNEVKNFSWDIPAKKCLEIYRKAFEEVS